MSARTKRHCFSRAALGAALLCAHACAAAPERALIAAELEDARHELASADPHELEARLNRVLAETKAEREEFASERFQAAELLTRLHSALSLGPAATGGGFSDSSRAADGRPRSGWAESQSAVTTASVNSTKGRARRMLESPGGGDGPAYPRSGRIWWGYAPPGSFTSRPRLEAPKLPVGETALHSKDRSAKVSPELVKDSAPHIARDLTPCPPRNEP